MAVKKIEMLGFKSFANKINLEFDEKLVCIVGPNGSGKSNIVDSIKWVMGETSYKSLRGKKIDDIIFSGSTRKKPMNFAQVSLYLENKDNWLNVDTIDIKVTRRSFRDGRSEFFINDRPVRLRDIQKFFLDSGLSRSMYSIISQGEVTRIVNSTPYERLVLFEEAAGVSKYKFAKEDSLRKLKSTEDDLLRVEDILKELESRKNTLSRQASRARKYKEYESRLLCLYNVYFDKRKVNFIQEKQELESLFFKDNELLNILKEHLEKLNFKINEISKNVQQFNEKANYLRTQKEEISEVLHKNKIRENENYNIRKNLEDEIETLTGFIEEEKELIKKIEQETGNISKESENLKKLKESLQEQIKNTDRECEELFNVLKMCEDGEKNIAKIASDLVVLKNDIEHIEKTYNKLSIDIESVNKERLDAEEELSFKDFLYNELKSQKKIINEEILYLTDEKLKQEEKYYNFQIKKENKLKKINLLKSEIAALRKILENYENFSLGVRAIMNRYKADSQTFQGMHGVVSDLIKVPKEYEKAIEVSLGYRLQNIVVKNGEVAKRAIDFLKKENKGWATFLSLDIIDKRMAHYRFNTDNNLLQEENVIGAASKKIVFDSIYTNLINYLLGSVIIVKNYETGLLLAKKYSNKYYKFVSLDGEILYTTGEISGGTYKYEGVISQHRKKQEKQKELEELERQVKQISDKLLIHESKYSLFSFLSEKKKDKLIELDRKIENLEFEMNKNKKELISLIDRLDSLLKEKNILEKEKAEKENKIEALTAQKQEIEKIVNKENIEIRKKEIDSKKEYKQQINYKLIEIEKEIEYFKERYNDSMKRLIRHQETLKQNVEKSDADYKAYIQTLEEIETIKARVLENEYALKKITEEIIELELNYKNDIQESEVKEAQRDELVKKHNALVESINDNKLKLQKVELSLENIDEQRSEKIHRELTEEENNILLEVKEKILEDIEKEIEEYSIKQKNLGTVNLLSFEEYESVKQRYDDLNEQYNDLSAAKTDIQSLINTLEKEAKEKFNLTFEHIKNNFQTVLNRLITGAEGDLRIVEDLERGRSGIDIIIKLPGKRFQNITLLSGGEKALCGLVLLFSLFMYKPSPFCILDEADAPLDDANIVRFINMIKEFEKDVKFICITHNQLTMKYAPKIYGVTMEEAGVSKVLKLKVIDRQEKLVAN